MGLVTVFQGTSGSAYVVAGLLRSGGLDVDITPPFSMYPCGPLRVQYVRVPADAGQRAWDILEAARVAASGQKAQELDHSMPLWRRLIAAFLLAMRPLGGWPI